MIVSHKYQFIFLKTRKTAGTSIELALRPLLGPEDIVTPLSPEDEITSQISPQNYTTNTYEFSAANLGNWVLGRKLRKCQLGSHFPAARVAKLVGADVWHAYFKFAFERNPWDRTVSDFFYYTSRGNKDVPFERFVSQRAALLDNPSVYCIDDEIAVDRLYRYESLSTDFADACARIGLSRVPPLPRAKSTQRYDRRHYSAHYDARRVDAVARMFRTEIERLGYAFDDKAGVTHDA